ncbi:hypothetical protein [Agrococcus sp. ARC_14]|uniref:hypothetical protein n=1 Tax=Agrococcus sp. ARC_14 TaxID=2919927 RepID=UPI001F05718C|nr:hypothetical protein [Agrococcus sp. ARC_14]MCH1882860.1 hypothetical protein [Agrococcus sp. ARC_14]
MDTRSIEIMPGSEMWFEGELDRVAVHRVVKHERWYRLLDRVVTGSMTGEDGGRCSGQSCETGRPWPSPTRPPEPVEHARAGAASSSVPRPRSQSVP